MSTNDWKMKRVNIPVNLPDLVKRARDFAVCAHGSQKYGELPYVHRLDSVHEIVQCYPEDVRAVAYLHDVVEDTSIGVDQINQVFGEAIAECVAAVTDEPGEARPIRKEKTNDKLKHCVLQAAKVVKAADRLANLRESVASGYEEKLKTYWLESDDFRDAVYTEGLCDEIWSEIDEIVSSVNAKYKAEAIESQVFELIEELREIKAANPSLKKSFTYCPGGILNAYRDGDVAFDEAVAHLKECIAPSNEARRVAIEALEVTLKNLKAGG